MVYSPQSVPLYRETPLDRLDTLLSTPLIPKQAALNFAREFYGERLFTVVKSTKLDQVWKGPNLTVFQTRILIAAMGHCLSLDEIDACLKGELQAGIVSCIREQYPHLLGRVKKASDLSTEELRLFLKIFRSPFEMFLKDPDSLWKQIEADFDQKDRLGRRPIGGLETRCMALTRLDDAAMRRKERPDPRMYELSAAEALVKYAGYMKPETSVHERKTRPLVLTTNTLQKKTAHYFLKESLHAEGVHAYFWLPVDKDEKEAICLFRGTNGLQSLSRSCLESEGIGKRTFERYAAIISSWISDCCQQRPFDLLIAGHSLGGIDAQRLLVELIEQIVRDPAGPLSRIQNLRVRAFAAPLLDTTTAQRYQQLLIQFYQLPQRPSIDLVCTQRKSDPVTRAGDFRLSGSSLALVVDPRARFNPHEAHSGAVFTNEGELTSGSFVLIDIEHVRRAIAQLLERPVEEESEDWVILSAEVETIAKQFLELQEQFLEFEAAQRGIRQRSLIVWSASETVNWVIKFSRYISSLSLGERLRLFSSLLRRSGQSSTPR